MEAVFEKIPYDLNVSLEPESGGSIAYQANGSTYTDRSFVYDDNITLTALPNPGWLFTGWVTNPNLSLFEGYDESNQTIGFELTGDSALTAMFEKKSYAASYRIKTYDSFDLQNLLSDEFSLSSNLSGKINRSQIGRAHV